MHDTRNSRGVRPLRGVLEDGRVVRRHGSAQVNSRRRLPPRIGRRERRTYWLAAANAYRRLRNAKEERPKKRNTNERITQRRQTSGGGAINRTKWRTLWWSAARRSRCEFCATRCQHDVAPATTQNLRACCAVAQCAACWTGASSATPASERLSPSQVSAAAPALRSFARPHGGAASSVLCIPNGRLYRVSRNVRLSLW